MAEKLVKLLTSNLACVSVNIQYERQKSLIKIFRLAECEVKFF